MTTEQRRTLAEQLRLAPAQHPTTIDEMRAGFAALMGSFPVPGGIRTTPTRLADRDAVLVEPEADQRPGTLLYFHGGSFILGSPTTALSITAQLVLRSGMRALSLDYRLAPEHPFPSAIDDGVAAYRELLSQGTPPSSIAFVGDSAGGGLSVTTCLAARDAGLPLPAAIVAFSPGLDHTRSGSSMVAKDGVDPFFTAEAMRRTGELYLAGQDPAQPLLAPAVHADLHGLPPMLLQVGTNELLLDDSVRLAERARDAGVDVILDVTADVPHVFQAYVGVLDEAAEALDRAALFLRQRVE
ncbi:alpha/beta hydrolase [Leifsonia sp. PS1209]|uniref:alpha/beta hydrolase n=1 Tax=Leifsonia sp. PS1209 TaxID=2724914 RepID=UPI001442CDE3|nr:alpha/beta hydrolase [Leifsonia sp. PS1209]QIZ99803.1 alpha/beta hydrolase [Leifsonia sp. PS1209]